MKIPVSTYIEDSRYIDPKKYESLNTIIKGAFLQLTIPEAFPAVLNSLIPYSINLSQFLLHKVKLSDININPSEITLPQLNSQTEFTIVSLALIIATKKQDIKIFLPYFGKYLDTVWEKHKEPKNTIKELYIFFKNYEYVFKSDFWLELGIMHSAYCINYLLEQPDININLKNNLISLGVSTKNYILKVKLKETFEKQDIRIFLPYFAEYANYLWQESNSQPEATIYKIDKFFTDHSPPLKDKIWKDMGVTTSGYFIFYMLKDIPNIKPEVKSSIIYECLSKKNGIITVALREATKEQDIKIFLPYFEQYVNYLWQQNNSQLQDTINELNEFFTRHQLILKNGFWGKLGVTHSGYFITYMLERATNIESAVKSSLYAECERAKAYEYAFLKDLAKIDLHHYFSNLGHSHEIIQVPITGDIQENPANNIKIDL